MTIPDTNTITNITADTPKAERLALVEKLLTEQPKLGFDKVAKLAHVRVGAVYDIHDKIRRRG